MPSAKKGQGIPVPRPKSSLGVSTLKEILAEAAKRQEKLNTLDNEVVDTIRQVESAMRSHISVRVSTTIGGNDEQGLSWVEVLSFGKHENRWQLLVEAGLDDDPDTWKTTPLVNASRETRVSVFTDGHVEKLLRNIVTQLNEQISAREEMLAIGGDLAESLVALESPTATEKRRQREARDAKKEAK